ncbi:DUF5753 domain-containing protein [Streptomyces sp. ID38640]|uniref:DUF5753 domain-containing protein n=1 Tax=Streptomyces sp. ID38640 TaxID=1265399 RepID=UPI00287F9568|nr:DUF5753 domain-containing protein [Streptomyces sp. ID38640]
MGPHQADAISRLGAGVHGSRTQGRQDAEVHGQAVPGLLQTDAYARALLRTSRPRDTDAQIERLVSARMERQSILAGSSPPLLWCILDEAVVRRPVGGPMVMRDQLEHLLTQVQSSHVVMQVLPFGAGEHPVMGGSLTLLSFERGPDVAYTESSHSGELIEAPEDVAEYTLAYDLLQAKALPPDESVTLVRSALEDRNARRTRRSEQRQLAKEHVQQRAGWRLRRGR